VIPCVRIKFQRFILAAGLAFVFFPGVICLPVAAQPARQAFRLHVLDEASHLQPVGRPSTSKRLNLAISLPLQNSAGLDYLLRQIYDPASTNYHRYLTPEQFTQRFGPTESNYQAVIVFAQANGLAVTAEHPNRAVLDVAGSVADIERVFHVTMRTYQHPKEGRTFFAPDAEPSVDLTVPILHVSGLDDFALPHPANLMKNSSVITPKGTGSAGGAFQGNDFRAAYVPGTALTGAGQTVGLLQFDGYYPADIAAYESQAGLPNVPLTNVAVDGGVSTPGSGNVEVALDIEMVVSMAPGLSQIIVYEAPNPSPWVDLLNRIANDNLARQISCSWGGGSPDAASEQAFKQMAAQGQSFFNATGDSDAFVGSVPFPSESTNITQVGGTTLTTSGPGGSYVSETVWNWGGGTGSSGGISTTYQIPSYQQGISMTANQGSSTMRNMPDVSLTGDNVMVLYNNGSSGVFGGTSCAAPLWAGFTALANQQAADAGLQPVGFLNPAIYEIGRESAYDASFHDIITGNNFWASSPANFYAVPGFDLCTGWGTPNGTNMFNALVSPDPFDIAPVAGFNFSGPFGGPFTVNSQNLFLTNSGASSLDWSVSSLPAWLDISSGGGTLTPGGGGAVTVSLNATANTLAGGTYVGYLWLTNLTGGIGHSRLFTLQVGDPLAILPTNGFAASGPVGGPFNLTSQSLLLTNLSGATVDWSLTGLPSWLTATLGSGTLPAFGGSAVALNLNSVSSNLPAGNYIANLTITDVTSGFSQTRQFTLSVGQSLVQNGGFETGDFSFWTLTGNVQFSSVVSGNINFVHAGTYGARLGPPNTPGFLSQTLPTLAGQTYLVSCWLDSPDGLTPNNFSVSWNGTALFSRSNIAKTGWTNLQFRVTASSSSTVLQIKFQDNPTYLGLDDVSVIPFSLPSLIVQPTNQIVFGGGNVVLVAAASGSTPLVYQWRKGSTNLINSGNISGAGSNALTLAAVTTNNTGNYSLVVTNAYGAVTSSVAALTVVLPPAITSSLTNRTIECGSSTVFSTTASGTSPLSYQWSLDSVPVAGATNTSFPLINIHAPGHTVAVTVTNLYGSVTSNAVLTVQDTTVPVITLNGGNPMFIELGAAFSDPGASATDACAGAVAVVTSGSVNPSTVGTNVLAYTAADGNGNTSLVTRAVIVRDTTPPTITWSFTNLVLAAGANCSALMPDMTGTNFILAADLSGALTISQIPTNNSVLPVGTNLVVITVVDASGNVSYSTNTVAIQDQTPPVIFGQPPSRTNNSGTMANFSIAATACTPLSYQWFFNSTVLTNETNSTLLLASVSPGSAGNYSAVVSAFGGSTTSSVAVLTVNLVVTDIALTSSEEPSGYNESVKFTASASPANVTGTVWFLTNDVMFDSQILVAGQTTSTNLNSLPRGTNLVIAVYSGDQNDLPATNSFAQIVTNHPPAAAAAFYTRTAGFPLQIAVADLAANWSDVDGDAVSLAGVGVSTNGVTVTNDAGTLVYFNSNNVADQFTYTISDGWGGTNFQTVNITVVYATPNITSVAANSDGSFTLNLAGAPGYTYILETTTDLFSPAGWQPIATNMLDISGVWQFNDAQAASFPQRFYRLKLVP
jgi:Pro-kumamolisin, activation domain/Domain of unknown function (DUF5011)/Cadherin-like domain/Immunoglobulin domain